MRESGSLDVEFRLRRSSKTESRVKCTLYLEMVLLLFCRTFPFAQTIPPSPEKNPESPAPFGIAVLSDTLGVDLGPYVWLVQENVTYNWYNWYKFNPQPARGIQGKASIEFAITKDGKIAGMKLIASSGDIALDRDVWRAVSASQPFPPLPKEFGGQYVAFRLRYDYSRESETDEPQSKTPCKPPKPVFTPAADPPGSWVGKAPKRGESQLEITVDKKGNVHDPVVIQSGGRDVDNAAIEAVRRWRFTPAMCGKDSKETKVRVVVTINLR